MSVKACVGCGNAIDPSRVVGNPSKLCPKCSMPLDKTAVDHLYPAPSRSDPQYEAKTTAREQALADVAAFEGAS